MRMRAGPIGVVTVFLLGVWAAQAEAAAPSQPARTAAEVEALIAQAGKTHPDWWDSVPLEVPPGLPLDWTNENPKGVWNPQKSLAQYIFSVINENPGRWKPGARLLEHCVEVNQNNDAALGQSTGALGHIYADLLQDYARAAYWYDRSEDYGYEWDVELANCDWKLGCKALAAHTLKRIGADTTRHGQAIKLWADIGELEQALRVAEAKAKAGEADIAWLMAGDACRQAGQFPQAEAYYQKVLALPVPKPPLDVQRNQNRAQACLAGMKAGVALDLKRVPDGTYNSESMGYAGPLKVAVTVRGGQITDVKIVAQHEKQPFSALTETPRRIIDKQTVKGVDTFSSATITSEAIINATAKALASGMK